MRHLGFAAGLMLLVAGCAEPPPLPPPAMIAQLVATVPADNPNCREYRAQGTVNGEQQPVIGRACRQPDGSWRIDDGQGTPAPAPVISQVTTRVSPDNPYCRDYSAMASFGTQQQPVVGRACELADGSWQVTQGTPEQPAQVTIIYPPAPAPYPYYAYDPWWPGWGPPFLGASFVFVGHHHHHDHDHHFGGHGHGGHGGGHRG